MFINHVANQLYKVALYLRLSQEDRDKKYESDSESIKNQRELLRNYCQTNRYQIIEEYVDDGYSGTNFNRPAFIQMIEDIKSKRINMVIVKDLSRLGRDHVTTGYYIETFFPENQVRFISIMESYDSFKAQTTMDGSTFVIASNDFQSRQTSVKIRGILDEKRKNGQFVGSKPSYGYMRDPIDKGHLIIDYEVAGYVKKIFNWYDNNIGISEIATKLTKIGAPTPSSYKGTKSSSRLLHTNVWTVSSVKKILANRIYTGDMIQHTQTKVSYKSEKKIHLPQSMWTIVENTHEPIVDKELYKRVNDARRSYRRTVGIKTDREKRLLEGLIYCKECGNRLSLVYRKTHDYWTVNCNKYARDPIRGLCKGHFFPYDKLEQQILRVIKDTITESLLKLDVSELNQEVIKSLKVKKIIIPQKTIKDYEKEKNILSAKIQVLYEDRLNGNITIENFRLLIKPYEKKIKELNNKIENYEEELKEKSKELNDDYTQIIPKLLNLENRELLFALLEKIKIDNNRNITISYKYDLFDKITFKYTK